MIVAAGLIELKVQMICLSFVNKTTKSYLKSGAAGLPVGNKILAIFLANFLAYLGDLSLRGKYQSIAL
jgi:hypothetical protein